jgi:predicted permease
MRWLRSRRRERDEIDREIQSYLIHEIDDNLARGFTAEQARRAAQRKFGNQVMVRESIYEMNGVTRLESIVKDLALGVRQLRRQPAFAASAIGILALGIAATTTLFSIAHSVLLRSLPYDRPEGLVSLSHAGVRASVGRPVAGAADYFDWRQRQRVFEDLALTRPVANFNLTGSGEPERLSGARATASLFTTLGVAPLVGRTFTEEEQLDPGRAGAVAVLSHRLWQRRFNGDPSIVGRTIALNGAAHEVLGIMPPGFQYPSRDFELWTPLYIPPAALAQRRDYSYLCVARLKPGITIEAARAQMSIVAAELAREHERTNRGGDVAVMPMLAELTAGVRRPLWLLLGSAGMLFLIGAVNLAGLLRARGAYRRGEFALRTSLGATRGRLARQVICETIPLAIGGAALGIAGAHAMLSALVPLLPASVPRVEEIGLHPVVLVSAVLLAIATAFTVAVASAVNSHASIARGPSAAARLADLLVVGQIAGTLILLVGAGLLVRSFSYVRTVDSGLQPAPVLSLHLAISRSKHGDDAGVAAYLSRLLDNVRRVPGVEAAGIVNRLPMGGQSQIGAVHFEGDDRLFDTDWRSASGDYFGALGVPLVAGRRFDEHDTPDRPAVGIIDERLARDVFGGVSPIGKRFRMDATNAPWIEVVGVVGHVRQDGLDVDPRPQVYWPYQQRTQDRMALVVKTPLPPASIAASIAAAIHAVDPDQPLYDVRPMTAVIDRTLQGRWLNAAVVGAFAMTALLLASVGLYGIVSYVSAGRRREFGIRMAVGATASNVALLVLRQGAARTVLGLALGLGVSGALAHVVASLLHGVSPWDPATYIAAPLVLALVVLTASAIPAWRASRIDPTRVLRTD